jgi:hypothetical protein
MIEPKIYCKVCGMTMQCIMDFYRENKRRPVVLEIGCADGQGTQRYAGFCEKVICVDPMVAERPDIFSTVPDEKMSKVDDKKLDEFRRRTIDFPVHLIIGCSLWPDAITSVKKQLGDDKVDILVIDGCHHPFEAVWGDFVTYFPLVSENGFVIFDDLYEDDIIQAYEKAQKEYDLIEHDRWGIRTPEALQDTGSLKRKK